MHVQWWLAWPNIGSRLPCAGCSGLVVPHPGAPVTVYPVLAEIVADLQEYGTTLLIHTSHQSPRPDPSTLVLCESLNDPLAPDAVQPRTEAAMLEVTWVLPGSLPVPVHVLLPCWCSPGGCGAYQTRSTCLPYTPPMPLPHPHAIVAPTGGSRGKGPAEPAARPCQAEELLSVCQSAVEA